MDARDSPIISALEYVREYLMKRIVIVQKVIEKCEGPLTPAATKLFNFTKEASANYKVDWNGGDLYQVKGPWGEQCVVNLNARKCSCRKWEVSGIPCRHVVACIHDMADNDMDVGLPESWVHKSYTLETWKEVYSFKVNPVQGPQFWEKFDCPTTLLPPKQVPQIGRPQKKRKRSAGEINMVKGGKLTRQGKTVTCGICKGTGHNKRSCPKNGGTSKKPRTSKVEAATSKDPTTSKAASASGTRNVSASQNASQAGTQDGTQAGTQAGHVTPTRMTKKTASRLTPTK